MKIEHFPTNNGIDAHDWEEVFSRIALDHRDVEEVLLHKGESPEGGGSIELEAMLRMKDGTFTTIDAWADYTGWGCQDSVQYRTHRSQGEAYMLGLSDRGREWFGIKPSLSLRVTN